MYKKIEGVLKDESTRPKVSNSQQAYEMANGMIKKKDRENFVVIGMNARYIVNFADVVAIGGRDGVELDNALILKDLIVNDCIYCVVAHNHPTGQTSPSTADIIILDKLKQALDLVGIKLMDNLIIGNNEYYSI